MIPMGLRLIFAQFACFLLAINFALGQMQNHGGQQHQSQHNYGYVNSYAFKWEVPFTYTYTIPPFNVNANQFKPDVAQVQPQQMDVSNPNYSAASSAQQQPSLQIRFGDPYQSNIWQNQETQQSNTQQKQQQPSLQNRFGDEDDQQNTDAPPQQTTSTQSESGQTQTGLVRVPILDDKGHPIGWRFTPVGQQNNPENSFMTESGSELSSVAGFGGGNVPQSTEPPQPVQTTQVFTSDSISGSSYRPQSSIFQERNPMLAPPLPPPSQSIINQIQQTELSQQPTMFSNSPLGQQTAGGASDFADLPKMCTAQQISRNLCPGAGSAGAHPSVSGVNFFTGQQTRDIDRLLQSLQSSDRRNAQVYPVFPSGDSREPAVGPSASGSPGGGLLSYSFTKA